jgi:septum formation protein
MQKHLDGDMLDNLKKYHIVLASNSPRRKELLSGLDIDFEVRVLNGIKEDYPPSLPADEVAEYIACEKADAYSKTIDENELIITADTVVIVDNQILGKPKDNEDACRMLKLLSGKTHDVTTGVCLLTKDLRRTFSVTSHVAFDSLTDEDILYYVNTYQPMDKAGAYGIQEWIGYVAVTSLVGSYFNVMGFPVQRIYSELKQI